MVLKRGACIVVVPVQYDAKNFAVQHIKGKTHQTLITMMMI